MDAEIRLDTPACVFAAYGPVAISIWRGVINVADLDAIAAFSETIHTLYPTGYCILSIATLKVKPPDAEVKKKIVELRSSRPADAFRGSIVVLAGDGFWASVMRSMLATLNLMGGMPDERHMRTLSQAAALIHDKIPSVDAADLERALTKLTKEAGVTV